MLEQKDIVKDTKKENKTREKKGAKEKKILSNENAFRAKYQSCRILVHSKRSTTTSNSRQESVSGCFAKSISCRKFLFTVWLPRRKSKARAAFLIMSGERKRARRKKTFRIGSLLNSSQFFLCLRLHQLLLAPFLLMTSMFF